MLKKLIYSTIVSICVIATGCSKKPNEKNRITVYTALETDEIAIYMKDFKAKHPEIKVDLVRDSTGIIASKLLAEKDNPKADLVWGLATTSLLVCDQYQMLAPYAPKGVEKITPNFKDSENKAPHWVGIKAWMTGFVCNTVEAKNENISFPKSYKDLVNPQYRGQIIMPNPASSGTGFLTVSAILQIFGEEEGWKLLDQIHKNVLRYTHSGSKPGKLAGKGECVVGVSSGYRGYKQKKKGEPVKTFFPTEKSGWDLEANALIKKKTINPAAKKFLDWAIDTETFKLYSKFYPIISTGEAIPVPDPDYPTQPLKQLSKNDFKWAAKNRARILKEWSKRYDHKSDAK